MKIQNNNYEVQFDLKGGEILAFTNKDTNIQYMYQGNTEYWGGKNPTLFPIVGSTYSKTYVAKGKTYSMKNHGIIRYSTLKCTNHTDTSITFTLEANKETLEQYPYQFKYEITYTLNNDTLNIVYHITNNDEETMPFGFGLHPAFRVPLCENETFEDYILEFENDENMKQLVFDESFVNPPYYQDIKMKQWHLNYEEIEKYETIVYRDFTSTYVTLKGKEGHGVKVNFEGYPFLALWNAKARAPYLCIEPWYSHDDYEKVDVAFKDREGMINLESGKTFTTSYSITVF